MGSLIAVPGVPVCAALDDAASFRPDVVSQGRNSSAAQILCFREPPPTFPLPTGPPLDGTAAPWRQSPNAAIDTRNRPALPRPWPANRKRGKTRGGGRYVIAGLVWAMSLRKAQRADYRDGREQGATMTN